MEGVLLQFNYKVDLSINIFITPFVVSLNDGNKVDLLKNKAGETLICFGKIRSYRFRQMSLDGNLYKVSNDFDYHHFFEAFSEELMIACHFPEFLGLCTILNWNLELDINLCVSGDANDVGQFDNQPRCLVEVVDWQNLEARGANHNFGLVNIGSLKNIERQLLFSAMADWLLK